VTDGPRRTTYDKLVRDRIPELIRGAGRRCGVEVLAEAAFRQALLEKLVEEATEAREAGAAGGDALIAELADLREALDAVEVAFGLSDEALVTAQEARRRERGGFRQRLRLRWTE
jgi:predicted house-cleaning noncanonical NTP pyrophosphatase (MazG superfamily)